MGSKHTSWREWGWSAWRRLKAPCIWTERKCEWLSDQLKQWAFIDILERLGHLAVILAVVFYLLETPERRKGNQYYSWQIINSLRGSRADGGRTYAIRDLLRDGVSLAGLEIHRAILPNADFRKADLRHARFEEAELIGADFQRAVLTDSSFSGAILNGADFSGAHMKKANFHQACLEEAHFSDANLEEAYFYRANLKNAVFDRANLLRANLTSLDFAGAVFAGANLYGVDLNGSDLKDVDFSKADLRRASLAGCRRWEDIKSIRLANIKGILSPPAGFLEWAKEHGAVEIEDDLEWRRLVD